MVQVQKHFFLTGRHSYLSVLENQIRFFFKKVFGNGFFFKIFFKDFRALLSAQLSRVNVSRERSKGYHLLILCILEVFENGDQYNYIAIITGELDGILNDTYFSLETMPISTIKDDHDDGQGGEIMEKFVADVVLGM